MPLLANDTDGALTRKRVETWAAYREKVTVVAATDAATKRIESGNDAESEIAMTSRFCIAGIRGLI